MLLPRLLRYLLRVTSPRRSGLARWDLIEFGIAAFGFLCYFLVRGAVVDQTGDALRHARWVVDLQASLGLWWEPAIQDWALRSGLLIRVMNAAYFWLDFPLIVAAGVLLFSRRRARYTLLRDSLMISGGLALIVYWTFPVAPPRFLPEWGLVDTLEQFSNLSYQAQSMRPFVNPFAAVPSLHVGWAALLAVVVFLTTAHPLVRALVLLSFVLQTVAVVITGNHYFFDAVAGLAVGAAGLALALALQRYGYPGLRAAMARAERSLAARETATAERADP